MTTFIMLGVEPSHWLHTAQVGQVGRVSDFSLSKLKTPNDALPAVESLPMPAFRPLCGVVVLPIASEPLSNLAEMLSPFRHNRGNQLLPPGVSEPLIINEFDPLARL